MCWFWHCCVALGSVMKTRTKSWSWIACRWKPRWLLIGKAYQTKRWCECAGRACVDSCITQVAPLSHCCDEEWATMLLSSADWDDLATSIADGLSGNWVVEFTAIECQSFEFDPTISNTLRWLTLLPFLTQDHSGGDSIRYSPPLPQSSKVKRSTCPEATQHLS